MKLLLVSDLHYTLKQFDWVHGVAAQFDIVAIAGDHLDISAIAAVEAQIIVISKYLTRLREKTRLLVSSGNHDLDGRGANGERVAAWLSRARFPDVILDGDFLEIEDLAITVCPWWDGPLGCAAVERQLAQDAQRRGAQWIWVYHAPPDHSPVSWTGTRHYGDAELLSWIRQYQPDLVLTGHIHQSPFRAGGSWVDRIGQTWVFNAGRQIGPCPTHVTIDLGERRAAWFSLAGNEAVNLDEPLTRPVAELRGCE
ncbi:MAG: metallophosphoesterase family protein [Gammaproteobacteria bacterium]